MTRFDSDHLAALAWAQLWQVTAVVVVVATLARLFGRNRAHLAYGLWMFVVLKCLTPPIWSSPTGIFCWMQPHPTSVPPAAPARSADRQHSLDSRRSVVRNESLRTPASRGERPLRFGRFLSDWSSAHILLSLWFGGSIVCVVVVAAVRAACSRALRRTGRPADPRLASTVASLARRLGVRRKVRVLVTTRPLGPAVFGVVRPTLVLPDPLLSRLSWDQVEPILAHELIHVRRGDLAAGCAQILAQVVWWFHPLVWLVNRAAVRERERCCDEESLAGLGCGAGHYARGLLKVLELRQQLRPLYMLPGVRPLDITRRRLDHIMSTGLSSKSHTPRAYWLLLAVLAVVLVPGANLPARSAALLARQQHQIGISEPAARKSFEATQDPGQPPLQKSKSGRTSQGDPSMTDDLKKLQGTWLIVSLEMDGGPMPTAGAKIVINGDQFTTSGMGATYEGTLTLDASKAPKTLDMAFKKGPEQGNTNLAIYEIDGDSWKLCLDMTGRGRPKAFQSTAGSGHVVEILTRESILELATAAEKAPAKKAKAAPEPVTNDAATTNADPELARLAGDWSGVSLVVSGQALPEPFLRTWNRAVRGNETTVTNEGQVVLKATFTIDSNATPKTIDYTLSAGPDQGRKQLGIYQLDGEITKYCFSPAGKDRPTEFDSKPGDGRIFGVWKKAKK